MEENFAKFVEIMDDPTFGSVQEWKAKHPGGKAVGCFPVYAPVELIYSAGMLPVATVGGGNQIEIAHADSRFQSFVCSVVKSTMELGLTDRVAPLDGMTFTNICDPARNLASIFKRNFPRLNIVYLHLPQNMKSEKTEEYLISEFRRVKESCEGMVEHPVTDDDLRNAIKTFNKTRRLVRQLYQIRAEQPEILSTYETYILAKVGTRIDPLEHHAILESALEEIKGRTSTPKDRIKVILEGSFCEQPPVELIKTIEEAGCYILDDDLLLGWRWFGQDIAEDIDPLLALAQAYIDRSVFSSVKHDLRETKAAHLLRKVKDHGAQAVVVLAAKFCEPALFDYALYRKGLEDARIEHAFIEFEEKMWMYDTAQTEIETFVESMLFD